MPHKIAVALTLGLLCAGPAGAATSSAAVPVSVAAEPLFAGIVRKAAALRTEVAAWKAAAPPAAPQITPASSAFAADVASLANLDMQGHVELAKRGSDGDLKCILKGIAQDLPVKLQALQTASTARARTQALDDMFYLLRDNVEVITSPPTLPPT